MEGEERKGSLAIPCARATRGHRLPSLDARTVGTRQAPTPMPEGENKKRPTSRNRSCQLKTSRISM